MILCASAVLRCAPLPITLPRATAFMETSADVDDLFDEAESLLVSAATSADASAAPPLLRRVFALDQEHLASTASEAGARRAVSLRCLQPAAGVAGKQLYNEELLSLPVQPGRRCENGACSDACSRIFRRGFASAAECAGLVALLSSLLPAPGASGSHDDLTLMDTAAAVVRGEAGAVSAHVRLLRLVERMRRMVAAEYGVPLARLRPRRAFVNRIVGGTAAHQPGALHADESSDGTYHYSGIVYLNGAAAEPTGGTRGGGFAGGDLCFVDRSGGSRGLRPEAGLAACFTSGWENVHGVTPVVAGTRYAVPMFFSTEPPPDDVAMEKQLATGEAAARDDAICHLGLLPSSPEAHGAFLRQWARLLD